MWPKHPLPISLLLLLLALLPSLPSVLSGDAETAPGDFVASCENMYSDAVPEKQQVLLDSYYYINLGGSGAGWSITGGWTPSSGTPCMSSVAVCNASSTSSTSEGLVTQPVNFTGATDPIYLSVNYTCQACPMCNISLSTVGIVNETTMFNCSTSEVPQIFTFPVPGGNLRLRFEVHFPDGDEERCVTLNRVRLYYYEGCSENVTELTNLPATLPGTLNNSTTCVDNAVPGGPLLAFCSAMGEWLAEYEGVTVGCLCSAGFEPNSDRTACAECGNMEYKATAGNFECVMCGATTSGSFDNHTRCVCLDGYEGAGCTECATGFFIKPEDPGKCMDCPADSMRASDADNTSCTCNTNHATSDGSTTTTEEVCNNCIENFYMSGGTCQQCPGASTRALSADVSSCTCDEGHTIMDGSTTTMGEECDRCVENYYKSGDTCEACPANSRRESAESEMSCTCSEGYATSSDSTATMGDGCDNCASGFARNSTDNSGPCLGIVVSFTQDTYTFVESDNIIIHVEANPPPERTITISPDSRDPEVGFQVALVAFLTSASPSSDIALTSFDDNIALQPQRSYSVIFSVTSGDFHELRNSATILVDDDDSVTVGFSKESFFVSEDAGKGEVQVELSGEVATQVRVKVTCNISTVENTEPSADSLKDCEEILTFQPGMSRTQSFEFDVNDDSKSGEDDEQYSLTLVLLEPVGDSRITLTNNRAFAFITDDDEEDEAEAFPLGAIIGVCVGGALLAVIAAVLCLVCLCIWRVNVNRRGFYPTYEDKDVAPSMLRYSASLRSISSQTVVPSDGKHSTPKENEYFV